MTDTFSRAIWISMMGHGIVVMILFLRAVIMPADTLLIQDAIRVDIVGLPEKAAELPKEPAPPVPAPAKPEPVVKEKPAPKEPAAPKVPDLKNKRDLNKSQKEAMRKLNAKTALDKIKADVKKEKEKHAAKPAPVVRGNQKADGNSLSGLVRLDFNRYADEVKTKVRSNNNIPQWLADGDYKATIVALIDENGYVVRKTIVKSSGNEVFDAKAIEALEASSPFPPPPPEIQASLATGGITFNFP